MIGEKLGQYTILEIVGSGGMGTVYKAEDSLGQLVALKLVRSRVLCSMEKRERFLQCLLAASEIRHEGICPILEIGDDNDDFFVIMPFIHGKTLAQYTEKRPIPWPQALNISLAVASALEFIHDAGTTHGGLKPGNIWIVGDRERKVLLSDCCISHFAEIAKLDKKRSCDFGMDFGGTRIPLRAFAYMSPEQLLGDPVDFRTDIFSFGVVLYEMLSGSHPFDARSSLSRFSAILQAEPVALLSRQSSIPLHMDSIIRKALAKKREERHQSIRQLMEDLQSLRQKAANDSAPISTTSGIRKWFSPHFWAIRK